MSSLVHTLAPPAPVASPTETIVPMSWSTMPGGEEVTAGEGVGVDDRDDGPVVDPTDWLQASGSLIGQVLGVFLAEVVGGAGGVGPVGEVGAVAVGFGDADHRRGGAAREAGRVDAVRGEELEEFVRRCR